jgi:serine/threonine protein kinase
MPVDQELKRKLDERLATGQITVAEYDQLVARLASPAASPGASPYDQTLDGLAVVQLSEGQVLRDKYRVEALLGRGAMGVVYRAHDLAFRKTVALKLLPVEIAQQPTAVERLRTEALLAADLRHDHIVAVTNFEHDGKLAFLVMEFVDGPSLAALLAQAKGPLPVADVLAWGVQACAALDYAHGKGLRHGDIKPANLMLHGPQRLLKLCDFGLARPLQVAMSTTGRQVAGTPLYAAPEQFAGRVKPDLRADLYSLALTLHECLAGEHPWLHVADLRHFVLNETPAPLPGVPRAVSDAISRGLAKTPEGRWANAEEFGRALDIARSSPVGIPVIEPTETTLDLAGFGDKSAAPRSSRPGVAAKPEPIGPALDIARSSPVGIPVIEPTETTLDLAGFGDKSAAPRSSRPGVAAKPEPSGAQLTPPDQLLKPTEKTLDLGNLYWEEPTTPAAPHVSLPAGSGERDQDYVHWDLPMWPPPPTESGGRSRGRRPDALNTVRMESAEPVRGSESEPDGTKEQTGPRRMRRRLASVVTAAVVAVVAVVVLAIALDGRVLVFHRGAKYAKLSPQFVNLELKGANAILAAIFRDANGKVVKAKKQITWTSSDDNIATVANGVVTAVDSGDATVTATAGELTATAMVHVQIPKAIVITPTELQLTVGEKKALSAKVIDTAGEEILGKPIAWKTSRAAAATVVGGPINGKGEGTATITATYKALSVTATVIVRELKPFKPSELKPF